MKKEKFNLTYLFIQAFLFVGLIFFFICWSAKWDSIKILAESKDNLLRFLWCFLLSFLPYVIKPFKVQCTKTCEVYFLLAVMVHFIIGGTFNAYRYSIFSSVVHFSNSFLMGVIIYGMLLRNTNKQGKFFLLITTTACVVLVGVLWELVEFSIDGIFGVNMQRTSDTMTELPFVGRHAIFDTMADLLMDVLGGFCAGLLSNIIKIKKRPFYLFFELKSSEPRKALFGEIEYVGEDKNLEGEKVEEPKTDEATISETETIKEEQNLENSSENS